MAGSIGVLPANKKKPQRWYVNWYWEGKSYKLYYYLGIELTSRALAQKLLDGMQGDVEKGVFRFEKWSRRENDIVPYLESWLQTIKSTLSPATYKDYNNSIRKHLAPFFNARSLSLHEIQLDTLMQLMNEIKREGKGKMNVLMCLHACLVYAWRANRIPAVPPFPVKKQYNIVEPVIQWLPSDRQEKVIRAIPTAHQPIFWWLKYHLRRPSEACALLKEDFDGATFMVQRGFSAKEAIDRTKTGEIHPTPAVSSFLPYIDIERDKQRKHGIVSPYFFVHPSGRQKGKHYTLVTLEKIWDRAAAQVGESIRLYAGLKHSTASQMKNEWGYTDDQIQEAGNWSRKESVKKYAKTEVAARRNLLEGPKVVRLENLRESAGTSEDNNPAK
jgi:integrase